MMRVVGIACAIGIAWGAAADATVLDYTKMQFHAYGQGNSPYDGSKTYASFGGSIEFIFEIGKTIYSFDDVITATMWGYAGNASFNYSYDKIRPKYWDKDVFHFQVDLKDYLNTGRMREIIGGVSYNMGSAYIFEITFNEPNFFGTDFNHAYINSPFVSLVYTPGTPAPIPLPPAAWLLATALITTGVLRSQRARQAKSASALIAS